MTAAARIALVIPALNEAAALPLVFSDLERLQRTTPLLDEIIVVDNGSTDATAAIARRAGATVLHEGRRGYGAACLCALAYLRRRPPNLVAFMDADRSDDADDLPALLQPLLEDQADMVVGSRLRGQRERGALLPQARFGNWLATALIRARFGFRYTDLGPFRAVRFRTLEDMRMTDRDFGWTIEMQIRALQIGARVVEVPVRYRRRLGRSKISGTVAGSARAGIKILATFWRLRRTPPLLLPWVAAFVALGAAIAPAPVHAGARQPAPPAPVATKAPTPAAPQFDHSAWNTLLAQFVDAEGRVAYLDLQQRGGARLAGYLHALATAQPEAWPRNAQLAFWINAYNAGMIAAVLAGKSPELPDGRDEVFKSWRFPAAGKERTLDEIEHEILRARFQEPRIHFAIVCAATSCPRLRPQAYLADSLQAQLEAQARDFINDDRRNQFLPAAGKMRLSKIFDWFRADFEKQVALRQFLAPYVADAVTRRWLLSDAAIASELLDYDWTLNAQPEQRPAAAPRAPLPR